MARMEADRRVSVVVATRDRCADLESSLRHLTALPERPRVLVVDNASSDGTVAMVRRCFPQATLVALAHNMWGAARTVGARQARSPYVAFSDDDSWWAPGSLRRAADLLDAHPRLGLVAATVLVGPEGHRDPTSELMARSPLPQSPALDLPGILGFLACGCVVRREAFLDVGGFEARLEIGGEEELLALDLASAGWGLHYEEGLVAHHHPSPTRAQGARRRREVRNLLWTAWLRYPSPAAWSTTRGVVRSAAGEPAVLLGAIDALREVLWVVRARRPVAPGVAAALDRLLDGAPEPQPAAT